MSKHARRVSWLTGAVCDDHDAGAGSRRCRKRAIRSFVATLGLVVLVCAALAAAPAPGWIPELLSSLLPLIGLVGLVLVAVALWMRARVGLIAASLAASLVLARLVPGLWMRRLEAPRPGDHRLSLLIVNAYSLNEDPQSLLRLMEKQKADITIITEPPPSILKPLRALELRPGFSDVLLRCPPTRGEHSWIVVRSCFPADIQAEARDGVLACIIQTPNGPVRLIACHLLSPRSPARFTQARQQVDRIIAQVGTGSGPIVIAGDFNAAPTSHLSTRLAGHTGTRRAKPLTATGTYPSRLPGVLRVAIDDALIGPGFRVVSWRTVDLPGSDHVGVRIDLAWAVTP